MSDEIICTMDGVRGGEGDVQLVRDEDSGRVMIRAINEGGFACTDVDLLDLVMWIKRLVPNGVDLDSIERSIRNVAISKCAN